MHARLLLVSAIVVVPAFALAQPSAPAPKSSAIPTTTTTTTFLPGHVKPKAASGPNRIAVTDLRLGLPIAKPMEEISAFARVSNLTDKPLENVTISVTLPDGAERSSTVPRIGAHGYAAIEQKLFAPGPGEHDLTLAVDKENTFGESAMDRGDNTARAKLIVTTGTSGWDENARKAAAKVSDMIAAAKKESCVEGTISPPTLDVSRIDIGAIDANTGRAPLSKEGLPAFFVEAVGDSFVEAYSAWARDFHGGHPAAFPTLVGNAKANALSVPVPLGSFGGSTKSMNAVTANELATRIKARLAGKASEPGASEAVKNLATAMAGQIATWLTTQMLTVEARNGAVLNNKPCRHLK